MASLETLRSRFVHSTATANCGLRLTVLRYPSAHIISPVVAQSCHVSVHSSTNFYFSSEIVFKIKFFSQIEFDNQ